MKCKLLIWFLFGVYVSSAEFHNLNFDSPNLSNLREIRDFPSPVNLKVGVISDLIPGWDVSIDDLPYTGDIVFRENVYDVPVLDSSFTGNSVYFYPSHAGPRTQLGKFSIFQIGVVPISASELITTGTSILYINGQRLSPHPTGLHFDEYGWDVSRYAGKEVKLEARNYLGNVVGGISFDIIGFAAPEPSEWALMLAGGCTLMWLAGKTRVRR